jgi:N-acetyl-gamma-glutamyl-phosphate reductase
MARDNGVAMKEARDILKTGCKLIDLSADFRFRDTTVYDRWYAGPHAAPDLAAEAVYGLPELHRDEIRSAHLVGNPGCYTTAAILGVAPLVEAGDDVVDLASVIIDAKSGVSGAGRSHFGPGTHFSELNESVSAYKIAGTHRHTPEIEQELSARAGRPLTVTFTPHLVPMTRGILATCYVSLRRPMDLEALRRLYLDKYADEPFVYVSEGLPTTKHTLGTNMLHIGLAVDTRTNRAIVLSCLDNLGKGMAGQAIQNMNLVCGLEETAGLTQAGIWP